MFDLLFERSHALIRQRTAPLADERRRYVLHCVEQGMAKSTVRFTAELVIAVEKYRELVTYRPSPSLKGFRCPRSSLRSLGSQQKI
jgi:hypothetical protein